MILRKAGKKLFSTAWLRKPLFKVFLALFIFGLIIVSGTTLYYYRYYSNVIDRRLEGEVFQRTARLYARPFHVFPGQKLKPEDVVTRLQRAGFEPTDSTHTGTGTYELVKRRLTIKPQEGNELQLNFDADRLVSVMTSRGAGLDDAALPAELVTGLSDDSRQKRRIVKFEELPPNLVNALTREKDAKMDEDYIRRYGPRPEEAKRQANSNPFF